jgi:hypothetical protein
VKEIDPSAFKPDIWRIVQFDGPPPLLINGDFLCSADSRIFVRSLSDVSMVRIPAAIEVIAARAFSSSWQIAKVVFESDTILKEIGNQAFAWCSSLKKFHVPSSVEIIGDRCFCCCNKMTRIIFDNSSNLKRIGERAFAGTELRFITIPASTEEIDGSVFVGCPLLKIQISCGNRNFAVEGNLLVASGGTEIVK